MQYLYTYMDYLLYCHIYCIIICYFKSFFLPVLFLPSFQFCFYVFPLFSFSLIICFFCSFFPSLFSLYCLFFISFHHLPSSVYFCLCCLLHSPVYGSEKNVMENHHYIWGYRMIRHRQIPISIPDNAKPIVIK